MFQKQFDWMFARFPRFEVFCDWANRRRKRLMAVFVVVMHILGALSSMQAIMSTRTPQGAIAWAISLNTFPYLAVPAYWVFGQSKFDGYEILRRRELQSANDVESDVMRTLREEGMLFEPETPREKSQVELLERLSKLPLTRYNDVDLLIDGDATFDAIVKGIESAENYVLFQFYILRDDGLGNRLKAALLAKAAEGVRVYVMYDGLGSLHLSDEYIQSLLDGGVHVAAFRTSEGWNNRFRLNFRNHRKIVVIDGKQAYVGGHNVGDEYLGKDPKLSPWRDTHVGFRGPVVLAAQVAFVEDWQWATGDVITLNWDPQRAPQGDAISLCLPTGPADEFETGTLLFMDLINTADERLWIASPYFVPDQQFLSALKLAAMRGVDVRVLIPENNDDQLVDLTSFSYLEEMEQVGIEMYRYQPGFMHQKVMLIDDHTVSVGTANFDNRSMRLNFEVTMLVADEALATEVEAMLTEDFGKSRLVLASEYSDMSWPYRFLVRTARLMAPIQ